MSPDELLAEALRLTPADFRNLEKPMRYANRAVRRAALVLGMVGIALPLRAQVTPGGQRVAFDVASVRVVETRVPPRRVITDTRVDLVGYSLRDIIMMAYEVPLYRLVLVEATTRLDIHATLPAGATRKQIPEMLRTLLAERFGMVAHFEPRPIEVCELTIATGGHKMREVEAIDDRKTAYAVSKGGPDSTPYDTMVGPEGQARMIILPGGGMRLITADTNYEERSTERGTTKYEATRVRVAQLADMLSASVNKPVIDKTELTGLYQFQIELPVNPAIGATAVRNLELAGVANRNGQPITVQIPNPEAASASAFKAVEGLGLKLTERRLPFDVLVVDKLARVPTPN